jgi:hypothetical protein
MSKYQLIDPGVDPTDEPNTPANRGGLLFWLAGAGLAVLIVGYLVIGNSGNAQAATDDAAALNSIVAATLTAQPTATRHYTATPTQIQGGAWLPNHLRATITPMNGEFSTATVTPAPLVQTQIVEVTRIVPGPVVPVITIQVITATPEPTYTPWIITVVVEVTPTPTETPTPGIFIITPGMEITPIPPLRPREEMPTVTPTPTQ